ncbi:uncharacterized protein ACO6RY_14756 [Pungitius sinensis]
MDNYGLVVHVTLGLGETGKEGGGIRLGGALSTVVTSRKRPSSGEAASGRELARYGKEGETGDRRQETDTGPEDKPDKKKRETAAPHPLAGRRFTVRRVARRFDSSAVTEDEEILSA